MISLKKITSGGLCLLVITILCSAFAPKALAPSDVVTIKWLNIEEASILAKKKPKKMLVDVYTDWCGWCKRMDANTFANPLVAKYVSENYYAVKLDAEDKRNIIFNDQVFKYRPDAKVNELAFQLLGGKLSYPSIAYLDEKQNLIGAVPGYFEAPQYAKILVYFKENKFKKGNLDDYLQSAK